MVEEDIIDYNNKDNIISHFFNSHLTTSYSSTKYTSIHYNLQYIKYDYDNGIIFKKSNIISGKSFFSLNYYQSYTDNYNDNINNKELGIITIQMNLFFDNYIISYKKLQTLLTEVMAVISLLFGIGKYVCNFLLSKKMNKDIITHFFNENKNTINKN